MKGYLVVKRCVNYLSKWKNRLKLSCFGIQYGKGVCIHGRLTIRKGKDSTVTIGDGFYYSSGANMNPLTRDIKGFICVDEGAALVIGHHVAMSSTVLWAHQRIQIGNYVKCGGNVIIMDSDAHAMDYRYRRVLADDLAHKVDAPIVIEDDVFIGMNSLILKGVTIGARSVIGAGSVVTKSVPPDCVACGNPARVIRRLKNAEV